MSDPVAYGTSKSTGRARKLKQRDERNVARAVSNTMKSAKDVDLETSRAKSCNQSLQQHSSLLGFKEDQSARLASVLAEPESNRKRLGLSDKVRLQEQQTVQLHFRVERCRQDRVEQDSPVILEEPVQQYAK
uniref:Transposable element Tc3 transposase-like DNA-binding HTH domain-containing protein n=1 Tax=Caenorhabditis japonica TaxID=281687 RepID=A0A8R1IEH7_CAEJA